MTRPPIESLDDLLREEEDRRLAETRIELAAEKAAWDALSDEERAAKVAAYEAKYGDLDNLPDDEEPEDDDDNDSDEEFD